MIKSVIRYLIVIIAALIFLFLFILVLFMLARAYAYYHFSDTLFTHWQIWTYILFLILSPFLICYWIIKYKFIYALSWFFLAYYFSMFGHQFVYDLGYLRVLTICDDEKALCGKAKKEFQLNFGKQAAHTQEEETKAPTEPEQTPELETETAPEPTPEPEQTLEVQTEPTLEAEPTLEPTEPETAPKTPQTLPEKY